MTAAVIFFTFTSVQFFALTIAIPIVLVIYYAYKMNLNQINQAQRHVEELDELYHSTISSLAMAIDAKDQNTHGHVQRVQGLALKLARHCGMTDENQLQGLKAAALLHDIGKLAIPEYILNKPSSLTDREIHIMRDHPSIGADILETVPFPYPVVPFVRHHHERWDGQGYPDGLQAEDIPLGARILSIADCYDALRSDRPYRPTLSQEVAIEYILSEAGKAYDPAIVSHLTRNVEEMEAEIAAAGERLPESVFRKIEDALSSGEEDPRRNKKTVFHEIASTHKEVQAVYEISHSIGKSLSVGDTLTMLANKIQKFVPCDCCVIYLVNTRGSQVLPYHAAGLHSDLLDKLALRLTEGVSGWVAANNKALMNVSPAPDFGNATLLRDAFRSCLSVPLALEHAVVGVVSLYAADSTAFQSDHLRLMETVAPHAAAAINNAIVHQETQEDAYTDLLTGLPNLRYFNVFLDQEVRRAGRINYPVTILMMDLENFKSVNDRYGHKVGDRVLVEISHILRNQLRKSDTCVRYGGDEFVGVLPGVGRRMARATIERIQTSVDAHSVLVNETHRVRVGISIGSASFPEDGGESDLLMALADRDMYRDKMERTRGDKPAASVLPFEKKLDNAS